MPRDSSGNYTLPTGNPVISGSTIASSWANNTLNDLAAEITDSLDRSGKGGMLAPFKIQDGALANPGLAFTSEPGSGIYRIGAAHWALVVTGTNVMDFAPGQINVNSTVDAFTMNGPLTVSVGGSSIKGGVTIAVPTSGPAMTVDGIAGQPIINVVSASGSSGVGDLVVQRAGTGSVVGAGSNINLQDTTLGTQSLIQHSQGRTEFWQFNGAWIRVFFSDTNDGLVIGSATGGAQGVGTINAQAAFSNGLKLGYIGAPQNNQSGNYTLVATDEGKSINCTAALTVTLPQNIFTPGDMVVIVAQGGVVTIAQGTGVTLTWANGGSTTGNRTLTNVGIATIYWETATQAYITGSGLS